jgi:hypothetical protein
VGQDGILSLLGRDKRQDGWELARAQHLAPAGTGQDVILVITHIWRWVIFSLWP